MNGYPGVRYKKTPAPQILNFHYSVDTLGGYHKSTLPAAVSPRQAKSLSGGMPALHHTTSARGHAAEARARWLAGAEAR